MRMWLYNFLKYRVLPWLDPTEYDDDEWGLPKAHKYSLRTRYLSREEHTAMLDWIEHKVHGKISMGLTDGYWQPKSEVLAAHRANATRHAHNTHPQAGGSSPFTFSRKDEFEAFKAAWG